MGHHHHHHVSDSEALLKSGAPRSLQKLTETAEESTILWVGPPGPLTQVGNTSSISHAQIEIFELHASQDSHECRPRHLWMALTSYNVKGRACLLAVTLTRWLRYGYLEHSGSDL